MSVPCSHSRRAKTESRCWASSAHALPRAGRRWKSCWLPGSTDEQWPWEDPPVAAPPGALFGLPVESAFEAEELPDSCTNVLTSSSSPLSSSSPENVEYSGLDFPSHPAPGSSPDFRPWTLQPGTLQSPLPKQRSPPKLPLPALPRPRSAAGRLLEPRSELSVRRLHRRRCRRAVGGRGAGAPGAAAAAQRPEKPPRPTPSGSRCRGSGPAAPAGNNPVHLGFFSPAPPSAGESSSPSPWTCQGLGSRLSEGSTPVASPEQPGE
ncbi:F-BAR domain only protein 1-like isoform X1 [Strigops habroptila]|uniref:F-BAR domain only protein 1-like isoform X1 n=1 Tax=Strigops habroptila TaxID=2489341 RepID=UPI0011CFA5FD|nr:F-BAR domain only protein 1-like isoform X1 [Strigops habroptila]